MKKLISLMLVLAMALTLAACGGNDAPKPTDAPDPGLTVVDPTEAPEAETEASATEAPEATGEAYTFTYGSTTIAMNADTAPIVAALGEPKNYTEEESCAFEGLSKTYFFGSFYLETYPGADGDYVHCVWLVDDSVATAEGIYIGSSQQDVESAYGAEHFDGANSYVMEQGDSTLTVILENGVVSSIQYDAIVG